ncbi:MAG TPA: type II toxin-antitoxin system MqsA family antitoxin [Gammaproteobacteria bacterium]|nr:type II toxin-antitoxin system MqsA family antitoxin [Gammaproteobacteria bacterium]
MNKEIMICPACEEGRLTPARYSDDFHHNGRTVRVYDLEHYVCDQCDADPIFPDQIRRNQARIADAKRREDGMMTGAEIKALRDSFGLSQQEAAQLFGGGANAFSKYERGDVIQSGSMDRLLWLIASEPYLLDYLRIRTGRALPIQPQQIYSEGKRISMNDPNYAPLLRKDGNVIHLSWRAGAA